MRKKMAAAARGARAWLGGEKGQNTVEYLLMLTVVVAVVLVAGMALKKFMPELLGKIQGMISGATDSIGR